MYDVVLVAFEGPDRYSFVGGLATRMIDLAEALVERGYRVRHIFVGDPKLPAYEERAEGRLIYERWCQWISAYHPKDVYDGEDGKWRNFSVTVPPHVADLVRASAESGTRSVLLFEDWQTANAAIATSAVLGARGPRAAAVFWNANNTYGFGRIDFTLLRRAASITTVSRFMRAEMSAVDVDAAVLPNGIAERWLKLLPPTEARTLKLAFGDRPTFVKVARFDPDKRWLWAIDAVAAMRDAGARPRLLMRGSRAAYADVVGARIRARGLGVERIALAAESTTKDLAEAIATVTAEVCFLDYFVPEQSLRAMYQAADGVLANSEKEPFGLVGLEVMASGGVAYVGRTGEDYAVPFGNAVVMQSDDPRELLATHRSLDARPEIVRAIRADGRATAKRFVWPRVLDGYEAAWETAFALAD
jgi:glycosyltransferase involved in cell wall biosynthesis